MNPMCHFCDSADAIHADDEYLADKIIYWCQECFDNYYSYHKDDSDDKPQGFYINVGGIQAHVLGDVDMDEKTEQAIRELVKCVYGAMGIRDPRRKPKIMRSKWDEESEGE